MLKLLANHHVDIEDSNAYEVEDDGCQAVVRFSLDSSIIRSSDFKKICTNMKSCKGDEQVSRQTNTSANRGPDLGDLLLSFLKMSGLQVSEEMNGFIKSFIAMVLMLVNSQSKISAPKNVPPQPSLPQEQSGPTAIHEPQLPDFFSSILNMAKSIDASVSCMNPSQ